MAIYQSLIPLYASLLTALQRQSLLPFLHCLFLFFLKNETKKEKLIVLSREVKARIRENHLSVISQASVLVILQIGQKGQLRDAQFVRVKRAEGRWSTGT